MDVACNRCTSIVKKYPNDDNKDRTLIHAARNGHRHCLDRLLRVGASVNYTSQNGYSALWHAVHKGNVICMDKLIAAGADVNEDFNDGTLLMWSAGKGHHNTVAKLIKAGGDPNLDVSRLDLDNMEAPLTCAAKGGHSHCALILLKAGADVNTKDMSYKKTALMYAADRGDMNCLKILAEHGADVNCRDYCGETALDYAIKNSRFMSIELLLKLGANVNNIDEEGKSVLMKALTTDNNLECVRLLIINKADVNHRDNDGKSALVYAVVNSCEKSMRVLIEKGADVNSRDNGGKSVLVHAAENNCEQHMRVLIEEGADVNIALNQGYKAGMTALLASSGQGHVNCVRMLLKAGAYVNKTLQKNGSNAIDYHLSCSRPNPRNEDLLKLLLVAGETTADSQIKKLVFGGQAEEVKDLEQLGFEEEQNINLMYKCRDAIRSHIATINPHINMFSAVAQLGLPDLMCSYLLYNLSLEEKE